MRIILIISALLCAACASQSKTREPANLRVVTSDRKRPNIVPDAEACQILKRSGFYLFSPDLPSFTSVYIREASVTTLTKRVTPSCGQSMVWLSTKSSSIDGHDATGDFTVMAMFPPHNDAAAGLRPGDTVTFLYQNDGVSITSSTRL